MFSMARTCEVDDGNHLAGDVTKNCAGSSASLAGRSDRQGRGKEVDGMPAFRSCQMPWATIGVVVIVRTLLASS